MKKARSEQVATIRPFHYDDPETGDRIEVSVSTQYAKLTINRREYFFFRETGEFDGAATVVQSFGPTLVSGGE